MADIDTYLALIPSQHADKPKYVAMVSAVAQTMVDLQNFLATLRAEFDIDTARWTSLDSIGVRVGLNRDLRATTPGLYVQAPDPSIVPLDDTDYQTLLRGKIGANQWNGTIQGAFEHLSAIFGDTGSALFMVDNQDMSMIVAVAGTVPSDGLKAALAGGYMQVRPAAVEASYVFPSAPGGPLFGFDLDNEFIAGFDTGVWAVPA